MFSKVAILATLSVALSVAASGSDYECNTGPAYCCDSAADSQTKAGSDILAIVGLTAQGVTGMVGANCSPVTVIGAGSGASCSHQPMCCEENKNNGLVVIGCTPVNVVA